MSKINSCDYWLILQRLEILYCSTVWQKYCILCEFWGGMAGVDPFSHDGGQTIDHWLYPPSAMPLIADWWKGKSHVSHQPIDDDSKRLADMKSANPT